MEWAALAAHFLFTQITLLRVKAADQSRKHAGRGL